MPVFRPEQIDGILKADQSADAKMATLTPHAPSVIGQMSNSHTSIGSSRVPQTWMSRIPAFGLLCALLSVFSFSISSLIVKLEVSLHPIEILFSRSLFQFLFYFVATLIGSRNSFFGRRRHRLDLFLRCLFGSISLTLIYSTYRMLPLSDATTIFAASPVFVTILAYFLLNEKLTVLQILTGTVTMVGVVIISKPEFLFGHTTLDEERLTGICFAVGAAGSAAAAMITLRKLKTTPISVVVMWYSFALITICSTFLTITQNWKWPTNNSTWLMLLGIGICGIADQCLITLAFHHERAGPISVVRTFTIVLSFAWEVIFLGEVIEASSVAGAALICGCVVLLAVAKWYRESPDTFDSFVTCFGLRSSSSSSANNRLHKQPSHHESHESLTDDTVQNTVNSNALLMSNQDDDDDDDDKINPYP